MLILEGYEGSRCEIDIDECEENKTLCGKRGTCRNENGTYRCECFADVCGYNCDLYDPCRVNIIFLQFFFWLLLK